MEIFENAVSQAVSMASEREETTWKGFRVVAIDGTKKNLVHSKELVDNFGVPHGAHYPQMLTCALYDGFSKIPLNLAWGPYGSSERAIALELIKDLGPGDLLLLDRGYPSFELLQALIILGINFMMRIPENGFF
ncbi:MAG: transposase [Desulfobulbaceae bacterium]|nr:transposase [Desulfobulbaceae bacterium]